MGCPSPGRIGVGATAAHFAIGDATAKPAEPALHRGVDHDANDQPGNADQECSEATQERSTPGMDDPTANRNRDRRSDRRGPTHGSHAIPTDGPFEIILLKLYANRKRCG
jgi:hypothetical protein